MRKQFAIFNATLFLMAGMVHPALAEKDCLSISHKPMIIYDSNRGDFPVIRK